MIFGGSPVDWKPPSVYDGMHPARIWRFVVSGTCQNIFILFFQEYILTPSATGPLGPWTQAVCQISEEGKVLVSQGEFAPRHLDAMECHGMPWNPGD